LSPQDAKESAITQTKSNANNLFIFHFPP